MGPFKAGPLNMDVRPYYPVRPIVGRQKQQRNHRAIRIFCKDGKLGTATKSE